MAQGMIDMPTAKEHGHDNPLARPGEYHPTSFRQWAAEVLKPLVEASSV